VGYESFLDCAGWGLLVYNKLNEEYAVNPVEDRIIRLNLYIIKELDELSKEVKLSAYQKFTIQIVVAYSMRLTNF
jgi:hypothetical protein